MILADTGFFLALLQPRDALHDRAQAWVNVVAQPLLVTEYILWEVINSLSASADRPKAHSAATFIRFSPKVQFLPASSDLLAQGLQLHLQRPDKDWSLTDCISFMEMKNQKLNQALAFDHHFEQAGFEALLRRDPP